MADYDKYYQTENLFGKPYKELIEYFRNYEPKGTLLDIGCGQGRDAIPLAEMGYTVTGIDNSQIGIDQMLQSAKSRNLRITGLVEDIYMFNDFKKYSIILLDSMIHFDKRDIEKEKSYLKRIWTSMRDKSLLSIFMRVNKKNESILRNLVTIDFLQVEVSADMYLNYTYVEEDFKSTSKYLMLCLRKSA
ncbi:MAG: class I SAM-dependent methyltransferase [Candidatus Marinimicrobia bacterium]|nr:class I SAM-dependent methyltransferase [Candidatus Neomarinimicrobiota bacterium]